MGDETARDGAPGPMVYRAASRNYRLHSFAFAVSCDDPALAELLDRFLVPFRAPADDGVESRTYFLQTEQSGTASLIFDGEEILVDEPASSVVDHLLWRVSQQAITSVTGLLALHAGAVAWRDRGILLPGTSGSGKSTLTAGLTAAGCQYLSDEAGLIDLSSGTLQPFPRALWMTKQSILLIPGLLGRLPPALEDPNRPERHVPPDALRAAPIGGPVPIRYVIEPHYRAGQATVLEPMRRSEAVISMMTNAFNFEQFKEAGLVALAEISEKTSAFRLHTGDLSEAVDQIMRTVSQESE